MDWKEFTQRLARELMHLPANAFLVVQVPGGFPYAQAMRYPTGLSAEVVSNEFLPEPLHLRPEQEHLLVELDWQRPGAHGHVNWWQQLSLPSEGEELSPEQSMAAGRLAMSMALALNRVFNVASPHHLEYRANRNGPDGGPIELPYFGIPSIDAPRPAVPEQPAPEPEAPTGQGQQPPGPATEPDAWHPDPYAPAASPYAPAAEPYAPAGEPYVPAAEPYAPAANPYAPIGDPYAPIGEPETAPIAAYQPTAEPEPAPFAPPPEPEPAPYAPITEPIAIHSPAPSPEVTPEPVPDGPTVPLADAAEPPASRLFFAPMHAGGVLVTTQPPITDPAEVERVSGYLRRGAGVLSGGTAVDEIEPARGEVVPMVFLTDGVWVWTGAQRYYLEHYGLPPYPAFYEHIVAQGYQTPDVPEDLLIEAGELAKGALPPAPLPPVNDPAPWLTLAAAQPEPEPIWQDRTAPLSVPDSGTARTDEDSWGEHPSWTEQTATEDGPSPRREETFTPAEPTTTSPDPDPGMAAWPRQQDTDSGMAAWAEQQDTDSGMAAWTEQQGADAGMAAWAERRRMDSGGGEGSSRTERNAAERAPARQEETAPDERTARDEGVPGEDRADRPVPLPKRIPRSRRAEPAAASPLGTPAEPPAAAGFVEQPAAGGISGFVEPPTPESAPGFAEPAAGVFDPPEPVLLYNAQQAELERDLEQARNSGDHRRYFGLILRAELFLPSNGDPAERQYATADFNDGTYVLAFTSPAALESGLHGQVVRHRRVTFKELLAEWPNPAWRLAINAGLATAAYVDPATVESLAGPIPVEQQPVVQPQAAAEPSAVFGRTIMQKVLQPDHVVHYLQHAYDRVAGYVYQLQDVLGLKTPALLVDALGLVYEDSPFSAEDEFIHVLRWPVAKPDMCRRSTLRYAEESIPEFRIDSQRLPHGSELYRLDRSGKQILLAVYDADRLRWRRPDA
jgi:hypothetical protein